MDLAALFANALAPGGLSTAPGAYSAQGTNSAWIMPGRDVHPTAPPLAQQTPVPTARPPQTQIDGASTVGTPAMRPLGQGGIGHAALDAPPMQNMLAMLGSNPNIMAMLTPPAQNVVQPRSALRFGQGFA